MPTAGDGLANHIHATQPRFIVLARCEEWYVDASMAGHTRSSCHNRLTADVGTSAEVCNEVDSKRRRQVRCHDSDMGGTFPTERA